MTSRGRIFRTILGSAGALTLIVSFQNCSKSMNTIDEEMKTQMLSSQNLFEGSDARTSESETGAGTTPGNGGGARAGSECDGDYCPTPKPPVVQPPVVQPPVVQPPVVKPPVAQEPPVDLSPMPVPVTRVCTTSNAFPRKHDSRVVNVDEMYVRVYSQQTRTSDSLLCESQDMDSKYREQIKKGSLDLSECLEQMSASKLNEMSAQTLFVAVDGATTSRNLEYRSHKGAAPMTLTKKSGGYSATMTDGLWLAYAMGPEVTGDDTLCDEIASPLVIDLRGMEGDDAHSFSLTSQERGVRFDILGENAAPIAHTPVQISWFQRRSGVGVLTLPNAQGEVNGINELFGDNTRGLDGQFAANGYKALAKYDDNGDGLITSDDAVFSKLRVWMDRDADGVAARDELVTLKKARIVALDLNYKDDYREKDEHGNLITYKSVVKFENGQYRLMFDIWFNLKKKK